MHRPTKRRRVDSGGIHLPDGFAPSKLPKPLFTARPPAIDEQLVNSVKPPPPRALQPALPAFRLAESIVAARAQSRTNGSSFHPIQPPKFNLPAEPPPKRLQVHRPVDLSTIPGLNVKKAKRPQLGKTYGILLNERATENMAEELASIMLREQAELAAIATRQITPRERGLELSPHKRDKYNRPKLTRNGLAAQATTLIDRKFTDFQLWKKELEVTPQSLTESSDMCASIVKILYVPSSSSFPCIALCTITPSTRTFKARTLYRIVFSLPPNPNPRKKPVESPRFREGQEIYVSQPWREISFPHEPNLNLPLPTSSTPSPLDFPIGDAGLLCSRFHVP